MVVASGRSTRGRSSAGRPRSRPVPRTTRSTSRRWASSRAPKDQERPGPRRRGLDGQLRQQRPAERHGRPRDRGQPVAGVLPGRACGASRSPSSTTSPRASARSRSTPTAGCCPGRSPAGRSRSGSSTAPRRRRSTTRRSGSRSTRRPASSGRTAASGPKVTKGFMDLSERRRRLAAVAEVRSRLGRPGRPRRRASAAGPRARRPPTSGSAASSRSGRPGARRSPPTKTCPIGGPTPTPLPEREPAAERDPAGRRPSRPRSRASRRTLRPHRLTIVAPSPPSPRSPGRTSRTSGLAAALARTASRSAPVPRPWTTVTRSSPASAASSR